MSDVIYWAVLLDGSSRAKLLSRIPPVHSNVFAEHMTIVFGPTKEQNTDLEKIIGKQVTLKVLGEALDDKGQAIVVLPIENIPVPATPHITISCAPGTKPIYSKTLLSGGYTNINNSFDVVGSIAKFTKQGWKTS